MSKFIFLPENALIRPLKSDQNFRKNFSILWKINVLKKFQKLCVCVRKCACARVFVRAMCVCEKIFFEMCVRCACANFEKCAAQPWEIFVKCGTIEIYDNLLYALLPAALRRAADAIFSCDMKNYEEIFSEIIKIIFFTKILYFFIDIRKIYVSIYK